VGSVPAKSLVDTSTVRASVSGVGINPPGLDLNCLINSAESGGVMQAADAGLATTAKQSTSQRSRENIRVCMMVLNYLFFHRKLLFIINTLEPHH
jgi:hypothetical protein